MRFNTFETYWTHKPETVRVIAAAGVKAISELVTSQYGSVFINLNLVTEESDFLLKRKPALLLK